MAYPCWRDWSETSNVLLVNKPIVRVVAFCRLEDHLNPGTRDVDLEIALSGSFHSRLYGLPVAAQHELNDDCRFKPHIYFCAVQVPCRFYVSRRLLAAKALATSAPRASHAHRGLAHQRRLPWPIATVAGRWRFQ